MIRRGEKKGDVHPSISSALGRSARKKKAYIPTLPKQRRQTSLCSLSSTHLYKIKCINTFQLLLVLFELGMLLKGKCADFAQKSHLPCSGEGCSVCEKELLPFTLRTSGLVWSDSIKRAQMTSSVSGQIDYCKSPGQQIELTI